MKKLMVAGLAMVWAMTGFAQNDVNFTAIELLCLTLEPSKN